MAVQLAVSTRNARLDAIETEIGTAPILKLRTGSVPANCATADSGTVLCSITLPSDWMQAAASGAMAKSATTWSGTASGGGGTVAHFRIYDSGGSTCHLQGTAATGSGDLSLDNAVLADGQTVTITAFTLTDGNA
jgi:hypothetical protein